MTKYLTPTQYSTLIDDGLTYTISQLALAQLIVRAEAAIDGYMGFDQKTGGFEPGIRYAQSAWDQESRRTPFPNTFLPVRQVNSYQIQVSNLNNQNNTEQGFFATVQPSDVAINNYQHYFEIVPLQAVTYSVFPGIMDFGLVPPIVNINCEQGFYLPTWGETLIDAGDHQTYWALRGFWATTYDQSPATQPNPLPPVPYKVYKNGSVVTSGFTADITNGKLFFAVQNQPTDVITLDYTYQIPDAVKSAAIAQTTFLLQRRAMTQMGLFPDGMVQRLTNADQTIQSPPRTQAMENFLCDEARSMLDKAFNMIPIG